jgi:hypothetical protein
MDGFLEAWRVYQTQGDLEMRKLKFISAFVLLALLLSASIGAVIAQGPPPQDRSVVSSYLEAQADSTLSDEDKIKNVIDTYFRLRYESQKLLEPQDFSFLSDDGPKTRNWAQREQDKREIELYVASTYRLNYVKYEYFLDYDDIEVENEVEATVRLRESHEVVFEAIAPEVSKLSGLEHVITLNKTRKRWVIVSDEYQDELTQLMANETKDEIIERVRLNRETELQRAAEFEITGKKGRQATINSGAWHAYNRAAAKTYADTWWNDRNPAWGNFDPPNGGGDCTNYFSQVIYAGAPKWMTQAATNGTTTAIKVVHHRGQTWGNYTPTSSTTPGLALMAGILTCAIWTGEM